MYAKALVAILFTVVTGSALLGIRQQRFEAMHDMATLHHQINRSRQSMWQWQSRIAAKTAPPALQQALERSGLAMEPVTPQPRPPAVARASHD